MASSSSSFSSCKYEVFLSFRGEDTRDNFTSHLVAALRRKKIEIFIDDELKRGDEISHVLLNAIERSKISVIIFSENYPSSKWCLKELVKILECKKINGQMVIPVFYHVDPSEVKEQARSFADSFVEQTWRAALTEASTISGWDSKRIGSEAELVDKIVKDILKKLKHTISNDSEGFIGLRSRIERLNPLLSTGLQDVRIVGIWGMGGIGKTTIAGAIFNQISNEFEGKSFMANIREESERVGLVHLRSQVLSEILEEDIKIGTPNLPGYVKTRLQRMKVVIVLDDVNKPEQLNYLVGGLDSFGLGSRIIVTTRDKQVLDKSKVEYIYEVERLSYLEANELFYNYAFRFHCAQDLQVLSESMRNYASGNPLALKVLGSSFHQKTKEEWENVLQKLKRISEPSIYNVLKLSYDELTWEEKNLFLDIACFFKGEDKNQVITILADRYSVHYGLKVLVNKSLITISDNKLQMHDLLQEMGREIVTQECEKEPGHRSRLWYHEDVCRVLKKNKGSDSIKAIFLDLSKIRDIYLSPRAFSNMSNLRLLKFYIPKYFHVWDINFKVHLPKGLEYLSDELTYLHWHGYPLKTLPRNFSPENLIELSLPYSRVQQLWKGKKEAFKLKSINLYHSEYITRIPDPSETPNLERMDLLNCINLSRVPSDIQNFNNLGLLCLKGCKSLRCFPRNIHFGSPITIDFSFCENLIEFPQISGKVIDLELEGTKIEEVPSSIESLINLRRLNMKNCTMLKSISIDIYKLKSLHQLSLDFCSKLESFPKILEPIEQFKYICINWTKIKELQCSIEHLEGLIENFWNLESLKFIYGSETTISQLLSSIVLPPLSSLSNLTELYLSDCDIMEIPEDIGLLSSLKILNLRRNNFQNLPKSIKQLSQLRFLYLSECNMLQSLPELPLCLDFLEADNCKQLQSLPELPKCLDKLDASILETLSQRSYTFSWAKIEFIFSNCPKLNEKANNILVDSLLRIEYMAMVSLGRFYEKDFNAPPEINICLPGSGIPKWFSNQSLGSSITIPLPQHCSNSNFIGFALCVVVENEEDCNDNGQFFQVICNYSFETRTEHFNFTSYLNNGVFIDSDDHVVLGFDPCWNVRLPNGDHHTTLSFDFSLHNHYFLTIKEGFRVKCCGVCPLYARPKETEPNTFTVNIHQPSEEECTKITKLLNTLQEKAHTSGETGSVVNRFDKEEMEPTPKRIFVPLF